MRILLLCLCLSLTARADFPPAPFADGVGVNIHFTDPRPGELEMLADAGFKWVRMDLNWGGIEREPGVYDFAALDRLVSALTAHHLKAIFILDYANRLYDEGQSPHTDAGRAAFAKWAVATVKHFAGRGFIWEMWNEPNIGFWKPKPDADEYAQLALTVGKALHEAEPTETYVGPATSEFGFPFIEACFKAGCLEYWSAVSVHPYRQSAPETAAADYRTLRQLLFRYAPKGKTIPILSGEWGYSSAWGNLDEDKQAKYLARQLLTNQWQEIPLSIWYDWHEDGVDPKEAEHHFGIVRHEYREGPSPVYEPKPAYIAMKTLADQLAGFTFNKRLVLDRPNDFALLFTKGDDAKLVTWTSDKEPHDAKLPASAGTFSLTYWDAEAGGPVTADTAGLSVRLGEGPVYLHPDKPNDLLRCAAACARMPLDIFMRGPDKVRLCASFDDPLDRRIMAAVVPLAPESYDPKSVISRAGHLLETEIPVGRAARAEAATTDWDFVGLGHIVQETRIVVTNPLTITVLPRAGDVLPVRITDPDRAGLAAKVSLVGIEGLDVDETTKAIELKPDEEEATVTFPGKIDGPDYSVGVQVTDAAGKILIEQPQANFAGVPFGIDDFALFTEGDKAVASEQTLTADMPPDAPPQPGLTALKLTYKSASGWKFWRVAPKADKLKLITGQPKALGLWLWSDTPGGSPRLRFVDATGQAFQPSGEKITWKGWRYITIPMNPDAPNMSHWGGHNDGVIHYPIKWDTLILLDRDRQRAAEGVLFIAGPTLVK